MAKTRNSGASYSSHEGRTIAGETFMSYGEGWKSGYHVRFTASRNGTEYIDKGTIAGHKIGETVAFVSSGGVENAGTIQEAVSEPRYGGGRRVTFSIRDTSGIEHNGVRPENITGKLSKSQARARGNSASNEYLRRERVYVRDYARSHGGKLPPSYYNSDGRIKSQYRDLARSVRGY